MVSTDLIVCKFANMSFGQEISKFELLEQREKFLLRIAQDDVCSDNLSAIRELGQAAKTSKLCGISKLSMKKD